MTAPKKRDSEALVQRIARMAAAGRAEGIVALDVRELVEYMDFLLICTGTSARRNRAVAENIVKDQKQEHQLPLSRSGVENGMWVCLDYVDVVVHIFDRETRAHYDLELLWADAKPFPLDLPELPAVPAGLHDDDDPLEEGVIEPPNRG